jgi:beta-lactamase regulating signal transducer with metallopeptidase domain
VAVEPAPVLSALWAAGMLAALALLWTAGRRESRRCLETARPAPPGIEESARLAADLLRLHEPPRIVVSDTLSVPAVVGVFRPIVVLPPGLAERETKERLLHVLLHEFAHVGRRDPLWGALVRLLVAAYWFHPAAWAAERRLALHRALLCDRSVARALGQPEAYQRTLVQFALQASCGRAALRTALMGRAPEVLQRVSALTRAGPPIVLRRVAALTLAAAVFLPMAPATLSAAGLLLLSRERPPGCLAFRHAVLLRLAAEEETR